MLISQGTDVVTVSKMLGHAKVSTTEDIYSHVIEESKQQVSNALTEVYFRRKAAETERSVRTPNMVVLTPLLTQNQLLSAPLVPLFPACSVWIRVWVRPTE